MNVKHNNKYLTFLLGEEMYGIPILNVREIIGMMEITHVPKMPEFVKGVINLRGRIIPVIDLRIKFGLEKREYDERTCIVVVEITGSAGQKVTGFIVDKVQEVLDIAPENMQSLPECKNKEHEEFLKGLGKVQNKVVMILDCNIVLCEFQQENGSNEVELQKEEVSLPV